MTITLATEAQRFMRAAAPRSPDAHLLDSGEGRHLFVVDGSRLFDADASLFSAVDAAMGVARAIAVEAAGQIYLLVWQAEDTEFQQLESVFHAISTSLFRGVADSLAARASGDRAV